MKKTDKESVAIAKYIHSFLDVYVPSLKNQSENTVKSHGTAIALFIGFLEEEHQIHPDDFGSPCFSRERIEKWLIWLHEKRGCSPETCNVRLASLRVFLKYLGERDVSMLHISQAATAIPRMKETKKKVRGMSKDAVKALMLAPDTTTATGRRDLALLIILYATAARLDEILALKVKQLHLEAKDPYVTIIGKGNKIRTLYLLQKAAAHLKRHLRERHGEKPNPEAYVFYSRNNGLYSKMSQTAVSKRLKANALMASRLCDEVPLDLHAHQLRHAKASHWLEDGMNIVQISLLLGHEQLETTMVYLDVTLEQKAIALGCIEEEHGGNIPKKWKGLLSQRSLSAFCGVKSLKK